MFNPIDAATVLATTYTAEDLIKIMTAAGVLLGIAGGIVVNIIVASRTSKKVDDNTAITAKGLADVKQTAAVIEGHVNSQITKYVTEIEALRNENGALKQTLADTKTTAAVLAASATQQGQATDVQEQLHSIAADVAETKATLAKPARPADARDRATDAEPKP